MHCLDIFRSASDCAQQWLPLAVYDVHFVCLWGECIVGRSSKKDSEKQNILKLSITRTHSYLYNGNNGISGLLHVMLEFLFPDETFSCHILQLAFTCLPRLLCRRISKRSVRIKVEHRMAGIQRLLASEVTRTSCTKHGARSARIVQVG